MKKKSKRTLKPKLRFPEFTEEWRHTTIGEMFNTDDKPVKATCFENDKILTVRLHVNGVVRNERTSALTGGSNYFKRRAGQFIFSKIDLLNGAFGIVPEEFDGFYSSSDVPAFSFGTEHSPTFFLNWLSAKYQRLDIERTGTSATLKRVSPEKFWGIPILLPSPPEQQKIAECLSSLDGLIGAEGRKLAALRDHKRGLMQQLFPGTPTSLGTPTSSSAGGERAGEDAGAPSQPRLRFPEFRDKGEWQTIILGDIVSISKGKGVAKSDVVTDGTTPCIRYAELYTIYGEVITHVRSRTD
ncbi:MAG TPA: restriction endonuclease subunit S, partial [Candidatus Hydrogenedentes bacterium]|nr:restriction endonuclease subunit S [Candidatus Hydrogenedentota bacterium]